MTPYQKWQGITPVPKAEREAKSKYMKEYWKKKKGGIAMDKTLITRLEDYTERFYHSDDHTALLREAVEELKAHAKQQHLTNGFMAPDLQSVAQTAKAAS